VALGPGRRDPRDASESLERLDRRRQRGEREARDVAEVGQPPRQRLEGGDGLEGKRRRHHGVSAATRPLYHPPAFRPAVLAFHPGTAVIAARANHPGRERVAPGHRAARSYYLRLAASRTTATRRRVDDVAGALKRPPDPAHRPAPTSLDSSGGEGLSPPSGARAFDSSLATLAPAGRGAPTRECRALGEARLSHVRAAQSLLHVGSPERTHAVLPHAARGVPRRR